MNIISDCKMAFSLSDEYKFQFSDCVVCRCIRQKLFSPIFSLPQNFLVNISWAKNEFFWTNYLTLLRTCCSLWVWITNIVDFIITVCN